jgi:hypothetical protein
MEYWSNGVMVGKRLLTGKTGQGVILNDRLCENSIGTLRLRSRRTDKYLDSNEAISFVVSAVEP